MAVRESFVDTGGTGDYASLDLWEDDFGGVGNSGDCDGEQETARATCQCTDGNADTDIVTIDGWTAVSADYYVHVRGGSGYLHGGVFPSGNRYRLNIAGINWCISVNEDYTLIEDIAATGVYRMFYISTAKNTTLRRCVARVTAAAGVGVYYYSISTSTSHLQNCLVFSTATGGSTCGVETYSGNNVLLAYNCTVVRFAQGIRKAHQTVTPVNCLVFDCTDCFWGAMTNAENNAFSEGSDPGTGGLDISGHAAEDIFFAPDEHDYHLLGSSPVRDQGKDLSGTFTDDVDGDTRADDFDIGCDEYSVEAYYRFENIRREFLQELISAWGLGGMVDPKRTG